MKSIKLILIIVIVSLLCACSHSNHLQKTVWINVSQVEENKPTALITTLEFVSDTNVNMYNVVVDDKQTLVKPFVYAKGMYKLVDSGTKNIELNINAKAINGDSLNYRGLYRKNNVIILEDENKVIKLYGKSSIKL